MGIVISKGRRGGYWIRDKRDQDDTLSTITDVDVDRLDREAQADQVYREHAFSTAWRIATEVTADIEHHFQKFGPQRLDGFNWLAVIMEEFGETVAAYNKQDHAEVVKEAKQTIACLMRLIVEIEREGRGSHVIERDRYTRAQ